MRNIQYLISNNVDVKQSLELFGNIETYNSTLGEFLVSANNKLAVLETYKNTKDLPNYAIYVHSIKSDAKYFGFNNLANIAYEHEMKSKAGDIFYIINNFQVLSNEISKTILIIKEYLTGTDTIVDNTKNIKPEVVEEPKTTQIKNNDKDTILVVDDSNIVRNFTKRIFEENYNIGTAKDGQEAIDLIEQDKNNNDIVAILLDLNMPKVDGFKVLEYMKENNLFEKIPVSIISGDSSKETITKAFEYPIVDMLEKPFNEQAIRLVVQKTLWFNELK